jgi:hypothetical protein
MPPLASRNQTLGFATRTHKNLLYLQNAFARGADVHVVTQLALSLLGLVVFPHERGFSQRAKAARLDQLISQGWPAWSMTGAPCKTLGELIMFVRHSIAHGQIRFSSDSRRIEEVSIEFSNLPQDKPRLHWRGSIAAADLQQFCLRFIEFINESSSGR